MDYTKTVWQNGTTPLNANNMNKIEDAIEGLNDDKVDKDGTKVLSDNNYSTIEKTKLENIEDGAQVNTVTGIKGDSESDYRTGNINISKANIGLGNTENTSDADKPISTATQAALNLKANSADVYNKTEIDNKISSVYKYKGSVASYANLPVSGNTVGDVWNVNDTNMNYGWTENSTWDPLGSSVDLSNYYNKSEIDASLNALLEGSEYISVDLNEALTKIVVELDQTKLDDDPTEDSDNLVKSGGVFDALAGKLDASKSAVATVGGLVTPTAVLANNELVGIGTNGEQIRIQLGSGLSLEDSTSPYTLVASGGGGGDIYLQTISIDATKSTDTIAVYFSIYTKSSAPINTLAKLKTALNNSYISGYRKYIAATGLLAVGTTSVYNITAIRYNYEGAIEITSYKHDTSGGGLSSISRVIDTYTLGFDTAVWKVI